MEKRVPLNPGTQRPIDKYHNYLTKQPHTNVKTRTATTGWSQTRRNAQGKGGEKVNFKELSTTRALYKLGSLQYPVYYMNNVM